MVAREGELSITGVSRRNPYIPVAGPLVPGFQVVDIGDGAEKSPRTRQKRLGCRHGSESNV
jgi:hypothetical protein